jgi:23S rRNA pseudouridine2605 synthase
MRLQRALARAGRRRAEDLIRAGRVRVNGQVAELGLTVDPEHDAIMVGSKRVRIPDAVWIALNKPVGYVVSRRDEKRPDTGHTGAYVRWPAGCDDGRPSALND